MIFEIVSGVSLNLNNYSSLERRGKRRNISPFFPYTYTRPHICIQVMGIFFHLSRHQLRWSLSRVQRASLYIYIYLRRVSILLLTLSSWKKYSPKAWISHVMSLSSIKCEKDASKFVQKNLVNRRIKGSNYLGLKNVKINTFLRFTKFVEHRISKK